MTSDRVSKEVLTAFVSKANTTEGLEQLWKETSISGLFEQLQTCESVGYDNPVEIYDLLLESIKKALQHESCRREVLSSHMIRYLEQAMSGTNKEIRLLLATQLGDMVSSGASDLVAAFIALSCDSLMANLLSDEDVDVAEKSRSCLVELAKTGPGAAKLFASENNNGTIQCILKDLPPKSEAAYLRHMELFVDIGRTSTENFEETRRLKLLEMVMDCFFTDDLLVKLNAVELMEKLAGHRDGARFLGSPPHPEDFVKELEAPCMDEAARMAVMRLLAHVVLHSPASISVVFTSHRGVFLKVLQELFCRSSSLEAKLCGIYVWGCIFIQPGSRALLPHALLNQIILDIESATPNICTAALSAWTSVLDVASNSLDEDLISILEKELLPAVIRTTLRNPASEVRPFAYKLLEELSKYKVTTRVIFSDAKMKAFLLDMTSDTASQVKYAKYDFVRSLLERHNDEWLASVAGDETIKELRAYVSFGAFYNNHGRGAHIEKQVG